MRWRRWSGYVCTMSDSSRWTTMLSFIQSRYLKIRSLRESLPWSSTWSNEKLASMHSEKSVKTLWNFIDPHQVISSLVSPTADDPDSRVVDRNMITKKILKTIRRLTGHDLKGFADRWLHREGCSNIACAMEFNKRKHVLEFAMKQNRSPAGRVAVRMKFRVTYRGVVDILHGQGERVGRSVWSRDLYRRWIFFHWVGVSFESQEAKKKEKNEERDDEQSRREEWRRSSRRRSTEDVSDFILF